MFSYTNQQLQFDNNSLFGQEDESGSNPPNIFPSSYDHDGYNDLLLAIQHLPTNTGASLVPPPPSGPPGNKITDMPPCTAGSRKRTLRRDRHSKIVTANGPRDRRMRLSLDVAKKFFELQDVLGYDKASKTVEWLLTKSKGAIKSLRACGSRSEHRGSSSGNAKMESSTSECEVDSVGPGKNDKAVVMDGEEEEEEEEEEDAVVATGEAHATPKTRRASTTRTPRKATTGPLLTKEWRAKARARARERTMEKRMWSSRFENGSLPKQLTSEELEHPSQWGRTVAIVEGGEQSFPMMMGHEYGGISTSDYSYNHNNVLHNADPFNSLQEYWNLHPAAAGVNIGEQRGTIDALFQTRGWNI